MSEDFEHLKWLRDGCKWLVTVTAGLIVTSATFYTDILGSNPKLEWMMLIGWSVSLVSIISGVACYFSAYKLILNRSYEIEKKSWISFSYPIMHWSFLGGVFCLGFTLIYNKL